MICSDKMSTRINHLITKKSSMKKRLKTRNESETWFQAKKRKALEKEQDECVQFIVSASPKLKPHIKNILKKIPGEKTLKTIYQLSEEQLKEFFDEILELKIKFGILSRFIDAVKSNRDLHIRRLRKKRLKEERRRKKIMLDAIKNTVRKNREFPRSEKMAHSKKSSIPKCNIKKKTPYVPKIRDCQCPSLYDCLNRSYQTDWIRLDRRAKKVLQNDIANARDSIHSRNLKNSP